MVRKNRSASEWVAAIFEGGVRVMVGCFVLAIVFILVVGFLSDYHDNPLRGRLPAVGPRVPIPVVAAATLLTGRRVYLREDCNECHALAGIDPQDGSSDGAPGKPGADAPPDLTHEGLRNADIGWQIDNLRDHHRMHPEGRMPDYDNLSPGDLRALGSFMATRK